ncbi:MAG: hypothetical protein IJC16_09695 [Rikenellaceae bacterium]|nr:hypothetical protein [Rikenellaceae bacterium]
MECRQASCGTGAGSSSGTTGTGRSTCKCGCPSCKRADSEIISIGKDAPERLFLYLHYRSESFNSWTNPDPQAGIDIEKLAPEAGQEKFNKQELYKMRERKIRSIRL